MTATLATILLTAAYVALVAWAAYKTRTKP